MQFIRSKKNYFQNKNRTGISLLGVNAKKHDVFANVFVIASVFAMQTKGCLPGFLYKIQ